MLYNNNININITMNISVQVCIQVAAILITSITMRLDLASYAPFPNRNRRKMIR